MEDKRVTVGGQAVVEGVMMRGPKLIIGNIYVISFLY